MADDRLRYALSEEQSNRIFRTLVRPAYLPDELGSSPSPTVVLLDGQPGAGTSRLLQEGSAELRAKGSTVRINSDDLRAFHPRYTELQRADPLNAARYTDADSGRWAEKLIEAAADRTVNLVIEGTMRRPEIVARTDLSLREAGYSVEARALAVPPEVSWLGVHQRFEATLAAGGAPRLWAKETHDAAVIGIVEILRQAESQQLVDRIEISNRAGTKLYESEVRDGARTLEVTAADTVLTEHRRGFSREELTAFETTWQRALDQMRGRSAPAEYLERVSRQAIADIAAVRARSLPQRDPASVATTSAQARAERSVVTLELRHRRRPEDSEPARSVTQGGGRSAGLILARAAPGEGDLMRAALDYARAWADAERQRGEGREPSHEQRRALAEAAEGLRRLRPKGPDDLVAGLDREARARHDGERLLGPPADNVDQQRQDRARAPSGHGHATENEPTKRMTLVTQQGLEVLNRHAAKKSETIVPPTSRSEVGEKNRGAAAEATQSRQPDATAAQTEWLIPPRAETRLTEAEIADRARSSEVMERQRERIAAHSVIVTGSDQAGKHLIASVERNAGGAFEIARQFAAAPSTEAGLAGQPGGWFRAESPERKAARAGLPQLEHAVHDYGRSLVSERERVVREHEVEERRGRVGVPLPSEALMKALEAPSERQTKLLSAAPIRQELSRLNLALHERLTTRDRKAIAANDITDVSKSLGVAAERVEAVLRTARAIQQAAHAVQAIGRQPSREPGINLSQ
jgi:hypothetical protein